MPTNNRRSPIATSARVEQQKWQDQTSVTRSASEADHQMGWESQECTNRQNKTTKKTDRDIGKHETTMQSTLIMRNQELDAARHHRYRNGMAADNNVSSKTRQDNTAMEIDKWTIQLQRQWQWRGGINRHNKQSGCQHQRWQQSRSRINQEWRSRSRIKMKAKIKKKIKTKMMIRVTIQINPEQPNGVNSGINCFRNWSTMMIEWC